MTSSEGERAQDTGAPERAPRRSGLRNWRVRSRLLALIAVPTVVAVALGAVGVGGALLEAGAYGRVGTLADIAGAVTSSVADVQAEQAESAAFVGAGRPADRARAVAEAQRRTDAGTARLRAVSAAVVDGYPESTRDRLRRAVFRLDTLPALRSAVTTGRLPAGVTVDRYDTVVTDLLALDDEIAQEGTDPELSSSVRALGALSRSRAALATQRALLESALLAGRFEPGGAAALSRAVAAQDSALEQFRSSASVAQAQRYDDVDSVEHGDQTIAIRDGITAGRPPAGGAAAAGSWEASATGALARVGDVEAGLVTAISDRADQLRADQLRRALIVGIVGLAVILIVLLATTAVARSLVRPLRALRDGALAVAERKLPDTVARLDREDPDTVDTRVEPIAVHSGDEIGEVARSFDAVHQEAVRAAAGEARRRAQAGALFVTLSRRTQSLVDRQIELIDDLERGEEDADRLESLFRLDHLATRMRRNGENLLVLGGQEPVRRWNRRLPLLEVLRAALSEIEQYPRIDLGEIPDVTVAEGAVSDVVHLLAELLDNATAFSSRTSRVDVGATAMPDGSALVEITDRGIGLTAQECAELDRRLAAPGDAGVDASRRMGLFVVGRLAARLGARVWLTPGVPRGVTASVALPAAVLIEPVPETVPAAPGQGGGTGGSDGSDGSWIGERFSRAVATPGPGADSWFGGAPLATAGTPAADGPGTADAGAGAAAFVPTASGTTEAGLPRREPGANEVPGTRTTDGPDAPAAAPARSSSGRHAAPDPEPEPTAPDGDGPSADRSPAAIRERYARYQRGRSRRRTDDTVADGSGAGGAPGTPAPSTNGDPTRSANGDPAPSASGDRAAGARTAGGAGTGDGDEPAEGTSGSAGSGATGAAGAGAAGAVGAAVGAAAAARRPDARARDEAPEATEAPEPPTEALPAAAAEPPTEAVPITRPITRPGADAPGADPAHPDPDPDPDRAATDRAQPSTGQAGTDRAGTAPTGPEPPTEAMPVVRTGPAPSGTEPPTRAMPTTPTGTDPAPGRPGTAGTDPAGAGAGATGTTRAGGAPTPAPDVPWGAGPVREPTAAGSTSSGLPLRAPGANYVPGSVENGTGENGTGENGTGDEPPPGGTTVNGDPDRSADGERPAWDRSAEAIRARFAAHQQGRRRGMERTGT